MESRFKFCKVCNCMTSPDGLWPELCGKCDNYYNHAVPHPPVDPERHWEGVHYGLVMRLEERARVERDVSKIHRGEDKIKALAMAEAFDLAVALCRDILGVSHEN